MGHEHGRLPETRLERPELALQLGARDRVERAECERGASLRLVVYTNTVRRDDVARNPRVAFTTWRPDGAAAIVFGRAREVPGSERDARPGRSGKPRRVVEMHVELTRIYAMRAPA